MAISVISISLDSSEGSVGAFTALVILFGTIPTTIPSIVPTVDSPTIPHIAPTIQYTSLFVYTDSSNSDTPGTPPSQDPYEVTVARLSRKRQSPTTLVHVASSIPRALSYVRFDLLPPRKRIKDYDFVTDFDVSSKEGYVPYVPKQIGLAVDVGDSYEPYTEPDIELDVKEDIDACIAFTDDIAARGTYARRPTEPVREDYPDLVCAVGSLEVMQRGLDMVMQELYDHMVEIQVISSYLRSDRDYYVCKYRNMPAATHFGIAQDVINELIAKCVAEALEAYGAARNPVSETKMENEQQDNNVEANVNNGNGNVNGNGNPNVNNEGNVIAAELTRLHDAIRIANNLMDQKFKDYAVKNAKNKKRVGHMTRDFKAAVAATALRSPIGNQTGVTCYECGRQGHYRSECP
nr:hypothetical protein [Tanacetum cinerariifolium]